VYFGLRQDFLTEGLCLSVQSSHSPVSTSFLAVLRHGLSRPGGWRTSASQDGARFTYCRGFEVGLEWNWRESSPCNLLTAQRLSVDYTLFSSSISEKRPSICDIRAVLLRCIVCSHVRSGLVFRQLRETVRARVAQAGTSGAQGCCAESTGIGTGFGVLTWR